MKKALIITYYWPPSGGGGVQRWLKFAKYLPQHGWQPVIYTPDNPQFDQRDTSLLQDVDKNLQIYKTPIREPYRLINKLMFFKKRAFKQGVVSEGKKSSVAEYALSWIRGNFFVPDPRVTWVKPSVKYLAKLLKNNPVDVIITTGPPHSMHLIGMQLKQRTGLPWVADFRDPWSEWDILDLFHLTKKARKIHEKLERQVVKQADLTLTVSNAWAEMLSSKGARQTDVITNGYDAADFADFKRTPQPTFRLLHAGMLNDFRSSEQIWQTLETFLTQNENIRQHFRLVLAGSVSNRVLQHIRLHPHLAASLELLGYLDHNQLMQEYQKASALLLLQNESKNSSGHIPGKFFEYLATGIPIFALGNPASDMAKLLQQYNFTGMYAPDAAQTQITTLSRLADAFSHSNLPHQAASPDAFTRENLTASLAKKLEKITQNP